MKAATVLYVMFVAGAFTGCAAHLRALWLRHGEDA
ncbi:MAG: hypothetical protein JWN08_3608 [Frankiales bacterium]|nr:hypothetical protein [Frankiales bacterium]MCW2777449.1 hypothetical protein [Frankiales bacterium]